MDKCKNSMLTYAKKLADENLCAKGAGFIAFRCKGNIYKTASDVCFGALEEKDISVIDNSEDLAAQILAARPDINAVLYTFPYNVCTVAKAKDGIPAVLDDMAQIVGINVKVSPNSVPAIIKHLKKRNSVIIYGEGCINLGRTLNEAYTNCTVLEKSACVHIGASVIGGSHKINFVEAKLMNVIYKLKYSKKNQENISKEEM